MFSLNNKISIRQLQILLILDIFGTGVTALPRLVAEQAGHDGWICIIIATLIAMLFTYILCVVASKFPDKNFVELSGYLLSKPVGVVLALVLILKIIISCALELRIFGEIIRQTLLYATPFGVVCAVMLMVSAFAASKGYETRARIGEILIYIVVLPLIVIFGIASFSFTKREADFSLLLPVIVSSSPKQIGMGALSALYAFRGIEIVMLVFPYLNRPKKAAKGAVQSVCVIGIMMTLITAITISRFGKHDVSTLMWPVLEMMDSIDLPGSFIERQDGLMMSFWIVSIFAVVNVSLFFSSILFKNVVKKGKHSFYILLSAIAIYAISFIPQSVTEAYELSIWLNYTVGAFFVIVVPCALLIASSVRGYAKREVS